MNRRVKIPGIEDVAKALRLKIPENSDRIYSSTLYTPSGVQIDMQHESRFHGSSNFAKVVIVIKTSNYPSTRRKVYVYRGADVSYKHDKVIRRPLTKEETKRLKEKYAEVRGLQKSINDGRKRIEQEQESKEKARETLQKILKKAGIDEFGDEEVGSLSLYTDRPHINISLSGKSPQQVVDIYNAVKKVLQAVG